MYNETSPAPPAAARGKSSFSICRFSTRHCWRQVMARLCRQGHPAGSFTWGNTKSLKELPEAAKINVRDELRRFWEKHYSASRMTLCVLGRESLDELEALALECFAAVKTDGEPRRKYDHLDTPYEPERFLFSKLSNATSL